LWSFWDILFTILYFFDVFFVMVMKGALDDILFFFLRREGHYRGFDEIPVYFNANAELILKEPSSEYWVEG
jgi:hypothetical protein